jgi:hypothetical protein
LLDGRALVLIEERVDELLQRHVRPVQRAEPRLAQLFVEDQLRLRLGPEAAALTTHALAVAVVTTWATDPSSTVATHSSRNMTCRMEAASQPPTSFGEVMRQLR